MKKKKVSTIPELKVAVLDAVWGGKKFEEAVELLRELVELLEKDSKK